MKVNNKEHLKVTLIETIKDLCKNGLQFKEEFSIDALIGITLDQEDILLISIKEIWKSTIIEPDNMFEPNVSRHNDDGGDEGKKLSHLESDKTTTSSTTTYSANNLVNNQQQSSNSQCNDSPDIIEIKEEKNDPGYNNNQHCMNSYVNRTPNNLHSQPYNFTGGPSSFTPIGAGAVGSWAGQMNRRGLQTNDLAGNHQMNNWVNNAMDNTISPERPSWVSQHQQSNSKTFRCDPCGKVYSNSHGLWRHKQVEHLRSSSVLCKQCGKSFTRKDHMLRHLRTEHLKIGSINCPHCSKVFYRKDKLNIHIGRCHQGQGPPPNTPNDTQHNNRQYNVNNKATTSQNTNPGGLLSPPFYQNFEYLNMLGGYTEDTAARSLINNPSAASSSRPVFPIGTSVAMGTPYYGNTVAEFNTGLMNEIKIISQRNLDDTINRSTKTLVPQENSGVKSKQRKDTSGDRYTSNQSINKVSSGENMSSLPPGPATSAASSSNHGNCILDNTQQRTTQESLHTDNVYLEEISNIEV